MKKMAEATNLIQMASNNTQTVDIDLDLSKLRRKRIRIDGDDNRILELDTSDLGVISRLKDLQPKLDELTKEGEELSLIGDLSEDENFNSLADKFKSLDNKMREILDTLFQSNVSEVCAPTGSMLDPIGGVYRWEVIIDSLINLYNDTIKKETKKAEDKNVAGVKAHTSKYIP